MSLQIKLLGTLTITLNGRPLRLMNSPKGCALLTYLLMTGERQPRERVADLLWDSVSTRHALQNFRELLARVRREIPNIVATRQTVAFVPSAETSVDLLTLQTGLDHSTATERNEALALYKGRLLLSVYVEGASRFNEWLLFERERLHIRVLEEHRTLCEQLLTAQDWRLGQVVAQRWQGLDAWNEEACRYVMRFSAEMGQLTTAKKAYRQLEQALATEMQVAPEAATRRLLADLEVAGFRNNWQSAFISGVPEPAHLPPVSIVPFFRNSDFVGRSDELLEIAQKLEKSAERAPIVALTGIGGVGKTQTAIEFAYRYGYFFPGGVFWFNFGNPNNISREVSLSGGARGLDLYRQADGLSLAEQVGQVQRAWQASIPRLLIFDNCEDEQLLIDWLPVTGGCRVLLTSRHSSWSRFLSVQGQRLDVLQRQSSVQLLQRLVPAIDREVAGDISAEIGDLPLALHLAGSHLERYTHISPQQYLQQLQARGAVQHRSMQAQNDVRSPTNHAQHLQQTFAITLAQIEGDLLAQQLLLCVACCAAEVLPQAIVLDFAEGHKRAVATLTQLNSVGLVTVNERAQVRMHRLIAQSVIANADHIDLSKNYTRVANVMVRHIQAKYEKHGSLYPFPLLPRHVQTILEAEHDLQGVELSLLASWWAQYLSEIEEPQRFTPFEPLAYKLLENSADFKPLQRAAGLKSFGNILFRLKGANEARPFYEASLAIYQQQLGATDVKVAQLINNLGAMALVNNQFDQSRRYFEQAVTIYRQWPISSFVAGRIVSALNNLALTYVRQGVFEPALAPMEHAFGYLEAHLSTDAPMKGWSSFTFGMVLYGLERWEQAQFYFQQAHEIYRELYGEESVLTARPMLSLGAIAYDNGNLEEADQWLTNGLAVLQRLDPNNPSVAFGLFKLGQLQTAWGKSAEAQHYLQQSVALGDQLRLTTKTAQEARRLLTELMVSSVENEPETRVEA